MLEALILAAGAGFLLGQRYRVPAIVVPSALAAILGPAIAYLKGEPSSAVLLAPVVAVVALQCGYLGGLVLSYNVPRAKPQRDAHADAPGAGYVATKK